MTNSALPDPLAPPLAEDSHAPEAAADGLAGPGAEGGEPSAELAAQFDAVAVRLQRVREETSSVIYGQEQVIEQALTAILAGGHLLLVGYPGLAKTRLVETLARTLGLETRRIQCTPDLMPADILGSEILEQGPDGKHHFRFLKGPVFTQLLMADEINRASPRTQSALLQAMQEQRVTVAGETKPLPAPFHTLATQNPLEHEGTYPLPEAQLDRFLLQSDITYPAPAAEREVLLRTTGVEQPSAGAVLQPGELATAQRLVRSLPIGEAVVSAILGLVRSARPEGEEAPGFIREEVSWGPGPRAGQALVLAARARALLHGRTAPGIQDVRALAVPVLRHRMALNFRAKAEGASLEGRITELAEQLA